MNRGFGLCKYVYAYVYVSQLFVLFSVENIHIHMRYHTYLNIHIRIYMLLSIHRILCHAIIIQSLFVRTTYLHSYICMYRLTFKTLSSPYKMLHMRILWRIHYGQALCHCLLHYSFAIVINNIIPARRAGGGTVRWSSA